MNFRLPATYDGFHDGAIEFLSPENLGTAVEISSLSHPDADNAQDIIIVAILNFQSPSLLSVFPFKTDLWKLIDVNKLFGFDLMLDRIGMDCVSMNIIVDGNNINTLVYPFSQKAALAPVGGLERHCERMDDPLPQH